MSEENLQKKAEDAANQQPSLALPQGFELIINKQTNEITVRDASGHSVSIKATVIEESDEEPQKIPPLTPDEFHDGLSRLDKLGLTWTADRIPRVKAKDPSDEEGVLSEEYQKIQQQYPLLPTELSMVVTYALTGKAYLAEEVGGIESLRKKSEIAEELVITPEYRSEFFFKHALKVPYLSNIDWELVFKLQERNVDHFPAVSYALLTLLFHDPNAEDNKHKTTTVALDSVLVNRLIGSLTEVKEALERGLELTSLIHSKSGEIESHADEAK